MKIVLNRCYGGFSLSKAAVEHMAAAGSDHAKACLLDEPNNLHGYYGYTENYDVFSRIDPLLVDAVEVLGPLANGSCAALEVCDIPDGAEYEIDDYDGRETARQAYHGWSV